MSPKNCRFRKLYHLSQMHARWKCLFIYLLLFGASALIAKPQDFGLWLSTLTMKKINANWRVRVLTNLRYEKNASRNTVKILQGNCDYRLFSKCFVGPGFRNRFNIDEKGEVLQTYIPLFEAQNTWEGTTGEIFWRGRIEYRIPENLERNTWEYRNYLQWDFTQLKLGHTIPFISEEIFWRERAGIRENRFQAGLIIPLKRGFSFVPTWLLRTLKVERQWREENIFVVNWFYLF